MTTTSSNAKPMVRDRTALWLFLAGSVLFPGALYSLSFGGPRWFGAVAPIGGLAFIAGWVFLAIAALKRPIG